MDIIYTILILVACYMCVTIAYYKLSKVNKALDKNSKLIVDQITQNDQGMPDFNCLESIAVNSDLKGYLDIE